MPQPAIVPEFVDKANAGTLKQASREAPVAKALKSALIRDTLIGLILVAIFLIVFFAIGYLVLH